MPASKTGLLIHFDEEQRRDLLQAIIERSAEPFSDTLSVLDWEIKQLTVALLGFSESTIDYIALAKKGKRVATSKYRIEFSEFVKLGAISVRSIESRLNKHIKHFFIKASQGTGGVIPTATWSGVIDAVKAERPNLA